MTEPSTNHPSGNAFRNSADNVLAIPASYVVNVQKISMRRKGSTPTTSFLAPEAVKMRSTTCAAFARTVTANSIHILRGPLRKEKLRKLEKITQLLSVLPPLSDQHV